MSICRNRTLGSYEAPQVFCQNVSLTRTRTGPSRFSPCCGVVSAPTLGQWTDLGSWRPPCREPCPRCCISPASWAVWCSAAPWPGRQKDRGLKVVTPLRKTQVCVRPHLVVEAAELGGKHAVLLSQEPEAPLLLHQRLSAAVSDELLHVHLAGRDGLQVLRRHGPHMSTWIHCTVVPVLFESVNVPSSQIYSQSCCSSAHKPPWSLLLLLQLLV